jgi:hypothetical protein
VADDKIVSKKNLFTNDSPNQEDSKYEDEMLSSKSLSPLKSGILPIDIDDDEIMHNL